MNLPEDFYTRAISALFLLSVVLFSIIKGGMFFKIFLILVSSVIFFEWMRMASKSFWILRGVISTLGLAAILSFSDFGSLSLLAFFLTFLFICIISELTDSSYKLSSFGFIYIALAVTAIEWLRGFEQGLACLIILLTSIIVSDISAYLVGNWLGGPKLFKKISPNKTLSGFVAAITFGTFWFYLASSFLTGYYNLKIFFIGIFIVTSSIIGDLFISFLKRRAGIKDTGFLIPGHGGVLDRADSILSVFFLIPFLLIFFGLVENPTLIILGW